jgi:hypothetical protein
MIAPDRFIDREQGEEEALSLEDAFGFLEFFHLRQWQVIFKLISANHQNLRVQAENPNEPNSLTYFQRATAVKDVLKEIESIFVQCVARIKNATPDEKKRVPRDIQTYVAKFGKEE